MGYTHYWNFKKNPKDVKDGSKKFAKAVELLKKCLEKVPAEIEVETYDWQNGTKNTVKVPFVLKGGNGEGEPKFTDELVCFNGDASMDYDHETCYLSMDNKGFNFCKTARKPYDVAVCITLICFKHFFGDLFEYSSDGNIEDGEEGWKLAREITSKYFE